MRVERTASTKLPSARESRASVACQYRAAACAEMFCTNLVCVWLMFNTLKVTQAEKQIYPQSCGKVKKAKSNEKPERSDFAGGRNRICGWHRRPVRRGDHQNDRREDDCSGNDGAQRDGLAGDQPAQEERHDGIHKRIRCHARRRALVEDVDVRAKADARPEYDEVGERKPGAERDRVKMQSA